MRIEARVGGRIFVPSSFPAEALQELRDRLTWSNLSHFMGRGGLPYVVAVDDVPSGCYVPRGAVATLREVADEAGVELSFVDERSQGDPFEVEHSLPNGGSLHVHQSRSVDVFVRRGQGLVVFPCGGGKTVVGLAAIGALKLSTLVLVHTRDLRDQWIEGAREQLGVEAVRIGSRLSSDRPSLAVGMLAGLAQRSTRLLREWGQGFGFCIVDECHHAPARTIQRVIGCMAARYRLGLTATPDRDDGQGGLVRAVVGPVLYQATVPDLVAVGRLVLPTVQQIETGRVYPKAESYSQLLAAVRDDVWRTKGIAKVIERDVSGGLRVIALTLRVRHCIELAARVRALGVAAVEMHGKTPRKKRRAALADFRSGAVDVLVGTTVADEGLDVPAADSVHIAMPSRANGAAAQRTGRVIRAAPNKRPIVREYVDENPKARRHWLERRRVYVATYGEGIFAPPVHLRRALAR